MNTRRTVVVGLLVFGAAVAALADRAICALRGHQWMDEKGRSPETGLQIWRLRCAACGARSRGVQLEKERRAA